MKYKVLHQVLKDKKMNRLGSLLLTCMKAPGREKTFVTKYFIGNGSGECKETNFERRRAARSGFLAGPLRTEFLREQG